MPKSIDNLIDDNINMAGDIGKMLDKTNSDLDRIEKKQVEMEQSFFSIDHYVSRLGHFLYRVFGSGEPSPVKNNPKKEIKEKNIKKFNNNIHDKQEKYNCKLNDNDIYLKDEVSYRDTGYKNEGILKSLRRLKTMSYDIGKTLNDQNKRIEGINLMTDIKTQKIKKIDRRINSL